MFRRRHSAMFLIGCASVHTAYAASDASTVLDPVVIHSAAVARVSELTRIEPDTSRPLSVLTPQAIQQVATLTSDFGTLANLLPSFVSSAPNGNGFDAAKSMNLRGFPDGQFNVTLDGIPFADPDGFSHHTTSIFPASSIESLSIDRSPGGGTTLGHATIGGSLNIISAALPDAAGAQVYGAYGSFATSLLGVRLNTAKPDQDGQTGLMLNVQHMQTAGALANNDARRDDLLLKSESRIAGMKLSMLYSYDDYHYINPPSVTTDQLAQSGSGVGLGTTPRTPLYNQYAKTDRSADFGYMRLEGALGNHVSFSETLYTFSYNNQGLSVNGDVTLPSSYQVGSGYGVTASDIAGRLSATDYRTVGNILQFERTDSGNTLRGGLWIEHSHQNSLRNAIDLSTGTFYNANRTAGTSTLYDYGGTLDTVQPYADYEWKATSALTVRPGLRYQQTGRKFSAAVIPTSKPGTNGEISRSVSSILPSLEANYMFTPEVHGYAQWSRGALTPNQSFFYTANPALGNQAEPQKSQALQGGVIYTAGPINVTADAYLVDLKDYVSTTTDANHNTVYANSGRVRYRGIETEGNVQLGYGLSAVANASIIRAQFRDAGMVSGVQAGDSIPLVPTYTALLGALYANGPWGGSVITKFVGTEYQAAGGSSAGTDRRVTPYTYTNVTVSRSLDEWLGTHHSNVSLQINNIANSTPITDSAGRSAIGANGPLLVNVLARRNVMLSFHYDL